MKNKENIGGRAYSNGLRLMNSSRSVKAYYNEEDKLQFEINRAKKSKYNDLIKDIPVLRGIFIVIYSIWMFLKEIIKNPLKYWFIFLIIVLDIFFWFGSSAEDSTINFIILMIYFLIPVVLIIFFRNNISEVLKYHGAEHKAVNFYENDFRGNIDDYSRLHKRCGSNFVFYFLLFQITAAFLNIRINIIFEYLLYIGLAYEAMVYTPDTLIPVVTIIQRFMTREPDEKHLKAAEAALKILTEDQFFK
jgi:uncharacterized protein YqhQ